MRHVTVDELSTRRGESVESFEIDPALPGYPGRLRQHCAYVQKVDEHDQSGHTYIIINIAGLSRRVTRVKDSLVIATSRSGM